MSAWYREGKVNVSTGSQTVVGVGTKFIANCRVGDGFRGPDGGWYEVINVASETGLAIFPAYVGAAINNGTYMLAPLEGYVKESADRLRLLVEQFGDALIDLTGKTVVVTVAGVAADNTNNVPVAGLKTALGIDNLQPKETGKGLSTNDYTTAEKTKLSGIATGATANSSNATLLARANHTGTQLASTISDFAASSIAQIQSFGLGTPGTQLPDYLITPGNNGNTSPTRFIVALGGEDQAIAQQPEAGTAFSGIHIAREIRPTQLGVSGRGSNAKLFFRGFSAAAASLADWQQAAKISDIKATGWGLELAEQSTSISDCNAAVVTGIYRISGSVLNKPGTLGGLLEVTKGFAATIFQKFKGTDATEWTRLTTNSGTAWSAWCQVFIDTTLTSLKVAGPVLIGQYTLTTLPSASTYNGYEIDVTNAAGGSKRCRSNGTVWQILNTTTTVS